MNNYEKFKQNSLNNTNTSINFIMDSLNKTDFELMKENNQKSKEKVKNNLLQEKNKKSDIARKKVPNKLESIILNSKIKYSKYNKVPHQSNNLSNINIGRNSGIFHPERGSDINCYKYYNSNTYISLVSETGESKSSKTIKNSHSFKNPIRIKENKFIINKFLKKIFIIIIQAIRKIVN